MSEIKTIEPGLVNYLNAMVELRKSMSKPETMNEYHYSCMEDFVIQNGLHWNGRKKPKQYKWQPERECYNNAYLLALSHNLTYVEGYATSIISTNHAWCLDRNGKIVDTTWRKAGADTEYYGVPFNLNYVRKIRTDTDQWSMLDNWGQGWPLLKMTRAQLLDKKIIKNMLTT